MINFYGAEIYVDILLRLKLFGLTLTLSRGSPFSFGRKAARLRNEVLPCGKVKFV